MFVLTVVVDSQQSLSRDSTMRLKFVHKMLFLLLNARGAVKFATQNYQVIYSVVSDNFYNKLVGGALSNKRVSSLT